MKKLLFAYQVRYNVCVRCHTGVIDVCVKFASAVISVAPVSRGGHQIFTTRKRRRFSLTRSKGTHAFCIQARSSRHSDAPRQSNIVTTRRRSRPTAPLLVMNMQTAANVAVTALITINRLLCQLCPGIRTRTSPLARAILLRH